MKTPAIEQLLLQEMVEVKGGAGICQCTSGAGQSSTDDGECKCQIGAAQKVTPTEPVGPSFCACDKGAAQSA